MFVFPCDCIYFKKSTLSKKTVFISKYTLRNHYNGGPFYFDIPDNSIKTYVDKVYLKITLN